MEIIKTQIVKANTYDKSKDGTPFKTRAGKPYKKVSVLIDDPKYSNEWLTCFAFDQNDSTLTWKPGDQVEIVIERNGQYLNFRIPGHLDRLEARVSALEAFMRGDTKKPIQDSEPPQDEPPEADYELPY